MIKTLYTRVVLTFSAVVLISVMLAFPLSTLLYTNRITTTFVDQLATGAGELADLLNTAAPADPTGIIVRQGRMSSNLVLVLIDESGRKIIYPEEKRGNEGILPDEIRQVLGGTELKRVPTNLGIIQKLNKVMVGMPVEIQGKRYALFVGPRFTDSDKKETRNIVLAILSIVLFIGSTLILLASRYVVDPIKKLTLATEQLAKGNFDVRLKARRKDELGVLTDSFVRMAGELKQIEQMRQDFVSNVSHEIQSPLTSIRGFSKLLKENELPQEEQKRYLGIIERESERLSRLSDNLLNLASLESEHHPFQPQTFDLDEQLRRAVLALEPQWAAKEQQLELTLQKVKIHADMDQLNQVWMNLIGNAIKFTEPKGRIRIRTRLYTDKVEVAVSDSGPGIRPEELDRIFERFYKTDASRQSKTGGSGLGLAIVRKIVELHEGTVSVDSRPGQGTTFMVLLPAKSYPSRG